MASRIDLKSKLLLILVVVISVFIPILFWRGVWFGAELGDGQIRQALRDDSQTPRRLQHALTQLESIIRAGEPSAREWHPDIAGLVDHPREEIRLQVAWVMGQDNQSEIFHQALRRLVEDSSLIVRRNAALALTRFGDASGRPVLLDMLRPLPLSAKQMGAVTLSVGVGDWVERGSRVAQVGSSSALRAPLVGQVLQVPVAPGEIVEPGDVVLTLAPNPEHVWEALRALLLVGQADDLPLLESIRRDARYGDRLREQARLTIEAIRSRSP